MNLSDQPSLLIITPFVRSKSLQLIRSQPDILTLVNGDGLVIMVITSEGPTLYTPPHHPDQNILSRDPDNKPAPHFSPLSYLVTGLWDDIFLEVMTLASPIRGIKQCGEILRMIFLL